MTYYFEIDDEYYEYEYDDWDWDKAVEHIKNKYPLEYLMKIDSKKIYPLYGEEAREFIYSEYDGYDGTEESINKMSHRAMERYLFEDDETISDIIWEDEDIADDLHDFLSVHHWHSLRRRLVKAGRCGP